MNVIYSYCDTDYSVFVAFNLCHVCSKKRIKELKHSVRSQLGVR